MYYKPDLKYYYYYFRMCSNKYNCLLKIKKKKKKRVKLGLSQCYRGNVSLTLISLNFYLIYYNNNYLQNM